MNNAKIPVHDDPRRHFAKRARKYNYSSNWVNDRLLIRKMRDLAKTGGEAKVLDIAIGTGKISQAFRGFAKYVVGIDISSEMARQAKTRADRVILARAERLPFKNNVFDACVCRQGMQFMQLNAVLSEIRRVLKPGGRVVLCHLSAYGRRDKPEAFLIQRLRNPARKNFFLPQDFPQLLKERSFKGVRSFTYITRESVNRWINNGALDKERMRRIKQVYAGSSGAFKKIHNIEFKGGDIFDSMKMVIVKAKKEGV